jgi:hypothetical protein
MMVTLDISRGAGANWNAPGTGPCRKALARRRARTALEQRQLRAGKRSREHLRWSLARVSGEPQLDNVLRLTVGSSCRPHCGSSDSVVPLPVGHQIEVL